MSQAASFDEMPLAEVVLEQNADDPPEQQQANPDLGKISKNSSEETSKSTEKLSQNKRALSPASDQRPAAAEEKPTDTGSHSSGSQKKEKIFC